MGTVRKPLYMDAEGFSVEMPATDELQLGGLAMSGNIAMGSNKITGLGTPTGDGDAANKLYVDTAVVTGGRIKEALASYRQLDNTDGINAAEILFFATQPAVGDTVVLKNGALTRTFTFVADIAGESAATDVSIETSALTAMQRLILRANADAGQTQWDLFLSTAHGDINSAVILVIEKATAAGASTSRIYTSGAWADPDGIQVVKYATAGVPDVQYLNVTPATPGSSDPGAVEFGFRRQASALVDGEIHFTLDTDEQWSWNQDTTSWYLLSSGAVPTATSAAGGGVQGKLTADEDFGLVISAGILKVDVEPDKGLEFIGGDLAAKPDTALGIQVGAGGLGIKLATSNPGLEFTGGAAPNDLRVKVDGAHGIVLGASGVEIEIDDTPDTLDVGANGLKVVGVPSLFKINGTAVSANVTATNLDTLTAGGSSAADTLHTHTRVDEAKRVSPTHTAGENVAKGDPVYVYGTNQIGKGDAGNDAKSRVWGVTAEAISSGLTGRVVEIGVAVGVGSGWTANDPIYLADGGGLTAIRPAAGKRIVVMGYALNATDLVVDVRDYGKRAA